MPFNVTRSAQFFDIEVLKYPMHSLVVKSLVLDANFVTQNTAIDQRTVVPAGTILALNATRANTVVPYTGSGTIVGILQHSTDVLNTLSLTAASEPVGAYFHEAIFATAKIVSFTQYASALVSSLPTCKFE